MIDWIILGGLAYLLIKDRDKVKQEEEEEELNPGGIPIPDDTGGRSDPSETVWTETSSWSGEAITTGPGGDNVVWFFKSGIRYQDGSTDWGQEYIVIGDAAHHNFLRSNSDRGTVDIKWEFTGNPNKQDSKNVIVFATLEEAIARAEELSNPEPEDDDPTGPQKAPEDDDSTPTQPSLPTQPGLGLGGGTQWTGAYMGGGM